MSNKGKPHSDQAEHKDKPHESKTPGEVRDKAQTEASEGKSELVADQKRRSDSLKKGGRSGVTEAFGKPAFIDSGDSKRQPATKADTTALEKAAEAIRKATKRDDFIDTGTDEQSIYTVLKGLASKEEREALKGLYEKKYHVKLEDELKGEMTGSELDKALRLLDRSGKGADDAGRIHTALIESGQLVMGRSTKIIESDIRTTLATMNSKDVAAVKKEYRERFDQDLSVVIKDDSHLSEPTKRFVEVYLKGVDQRTTGDVMQLADIALKEKDIDLFKETFSHAAPEARKHFLDHDGEKKMQEAFGGSLFNLSKFISPPLIFQKGMNITDKELDQAKQYASHGKLDAAHRVRNDSSVLGDNEKGIEQTLREMAPKERERYLWGRELAKTTPDAAAMSEFDKESLVYYKDLHKALAGAGNATEVARWEDMIAHKGGTLISKLAAERGLMGNHNTDGVMSVLENMGKDDWERLKNDPDYRKELSAVMKTMLSKEEIARAEALLTKKLDGDATTYETADKQGRRPLVETIADNTHWYHNDRQRIVEAIMALTPKEQQLVRSDRYYQQRLAEKVGEALGDTAYGKCASYLFGKVAAGQAPSADLITKIYDQAARTDIDEAQVVAELQKAMTNDPSLKSRLTDPKSDADRAFGKELQKALFTALNTSEYLAYALPLFSTGEVKATSLKELNEGVFSDNKKRFIDGLIGVSAFERDLLSSEPGTNKTAQDLQKSAFGHLSEDEKAVARYALKQGEVKAEDALRLFILGSYSDKDDLKQTLSRMDAGNRAHLREDYQKKYGSDPLHPLLDSMKGEDRDAFAQLLPRPEASSRQLFGEALDQYGDSRSGVGGALVDEVWDGTGVHLDDAMARYARSLADSARRFEELPEEKRKVLAENLGRALTLYKESKEAAADAAVDTMLAVGSVAAAPFSGGVSLGYLLVAAGAAGATLNVSARALVVGSDYDWTAGQLATDVAKGFVNGMASIVGPAEVAALFKVGEKAGVVAAGKSLEKIAMAGAEKALKPEAAKILEDGTKELVRKAIANGEASIDNKSILALADKLVAGKLSGEARKKAVVDVADAIHWSLAEGIREESKGAFKRTLKHIALNASAGSAGGGASGVVDGLARWDTTETIGQNLERTGEAALAGAVFGGAGAGLGTAAFDSMSAIGKHFKKGSADAIKAEGGWYRLDPGGPMLDYLPKRDYDVNGQRYTLKAREEGGKWYYPEPRDKDVGPIKIFVTVGDTADLGRVQKALIPALEDQQSELGKLVADYRTLDPRYGTGSWDHNEWGKLPQGKTNGFEIAVSTPEEALKVEEKVNALLKKDGLAGADSGGRVFLSREHYEPAFDNYGQVMGAKLDPQIVDGIHKRLNLPDGAKLTDDQLRGLEQEAGIKNGLLSYDRHGDLALSDLDDKGQVRGGMRYALGKNGEHYPLDYFLPEGGGDTSRAAFRSLAKKYAGLEPAELLAKAK